MPVTTIYLLRHAIRLPYFLDGITGIYSSNTPYPTNLPGDPPLTAKGVEQTHELAQHLSSILGPAAESDTLRVYSSCFYRCPQTLKPWVELMKAEKGLDLKVRGETGIGEWFGYAKRFTHPVPMPPQGLNEKFFPFIDPDYSAGRNLGPDAHGETIEGLHDRLARNLQFIIRAVEAEYRETGRGEEDITLLCCFHAAPLIASGRVLTGQVPEDWNVDDFQCFTAGLSKYTRKEPPVTSSQPPKSTSLFSSPSIETPNWRNGGVYPGWICEQNSDTSFLSDGPERGWHFNGDESFDDPVNDPRMTSTGLLKDSGGFGDEEEGGKKEKKATGGDESKL